MADDHALKSLATARGWYVSEAAAKLINVGLQHADELPEDLPRRVSRSESTDFTARIPLTDNEVLRGIAGERDRSISVVAGALLHLGLRYRNEIPGQIPAQYTKARWAPGCARSRARSTVRSASRTWTLGRPAAAAAGRGHTPLIELLHTSRPPLKVVGAVAADQTVQAIQAGDIYGSMYQNSYGQAYISAYVLQKVINEGCLAPGLMEGVKPGDDEQRWQPHGSTPTSCGNERSGWSSTPRSTLSTPAGTSAAVSVTSWESIRKPCAAG